MSVLNKMCCVKLLFSSSIARNSLFYSSFADKNYYDIIITGGGMVGTTLACTLGKNKRLSNKRILLLEAGKPLKYLKTEKYSNRVSAINLCSQRLMNDINAWRHIYRYASVRKLQVWDALSDAMITFDNDDVLQPVAYIVENDLLLSAVGEELGGIENVTVVNDAKVKLYELPLEKNKTTKVKLEDGNVLQCSLLLGCDGSNSKVREAMGVHYLSWNYDQMGVVATLRLTDVDDNSVAWQKFLPSGPIALLPLTNEFSSLVWSTGLEHARSLLSLPEEQFVDAVNDAIWKRHERQPLAEGALRIVDGLLDAALNRQPNAVRQLPPTVGGCEAGTRAAFPLGFGHATNYIGVGVALVGDAAHRVHPLAGQGVNLGFGDVVAINRALGEAVYAGTDVANIEYLKRYESERQKHNVPTMLAIEGLHRLYKTSFGPLVALRSLGLQVMHALPPLKRVIIEQAAN